MDEAAIPLDPPAADPPAGAFVRGLRRVNGAICAAEDSIVVWLFFAMLAGFLVQVFARFVIRYPLPWSEEFCRHLFIWMGGLGASIGIRWGAHFIAFDLQAHLRGFARHTAIAIVKLSVGLIAVILLVEGIRFTHEGMNQFTPILSIPMALPNAAVPVSAALILWHLAYTWVFGQKGGAMEDMLGLEAREG